MKKLYLSGLFWALLCLFGSFSGNLFAQTMPTPKALPYFQNFDNLVDNPTTYPDGFQGWTVSGAPGSAFKVSAPTADKELVAIVTNAPASASSTAGNIYNYTGKIGFLNTSSLDFTIGLALNATGQSSIPVRYDAMTIRNPYGDGTNTRINEMVLQYRVGTTGDFKSIDGTVYSNNTITQIGSGNTSGQNPLEVNIILPTECDNQPIVQIRWISKQVSGSGSRPSFAIDNVKVGRDITAPVDISGFPKANTILATSFDFVSKIDEAGKTYFVLLSGGSASPTVAQVKAGLDSNGTAALQSGSLDIIDSEKEYAKTFSGLTLNTNYTVFSVSEDTSGNIQSVVNKIDVTTSATVLPVITTSVAALDFGLTEINLESVSKSYQIQVADLTSDLELSVTQNFSISKDNITFGSTLTFAAADFASNASQTVYVKFNPNLATVHTGQITHQSASIIKNISLLGRGINPYVQNFDDSNVLSNSGWTQYDLAGTTNKWGYTTVARNVNSGTGAVLINGYTDSGASKDWLISPKLRLDSFDKLPLLSFYSRKFYPGPSLKLMVSTNYDGVSSPETATWTEINGEFPTVTGAYVKSQYIDLSAFKTSHTYLAWVYETAMGGGTGNASEWSFDDYAIVNESGYVASNPVLDFGTIDQNTISVSQSFDFKAKGYGNITITAPAGYQISADNSSFQNSVVLTEADALAGKALYARFMPTSKEFKIAGPLTVTGTSLNKQIGSLKGSSLPKAETFDVVTYNLEFFGAPTKDYGPEDKALQLENVSKVMNKLDADVYVVQEVSSDAQIDALIAKININGKTFEKTVSTSWSYSWDPTSDPSFPPQKLVVIYNTKTTTLKKTRVMFKDFYDELRAGTKTLNNYPEGNNKSFFSSGRLPYMVTLETNLNGVKNEINFIDLHARANSGTDISRYNMRKYDTQVLKDSLDTHYANSNIILLGDYNDDVKASVIAGQPSSYEAFVTDTNNYNALTLGISQAGAYSFLSSGGFLDHITISNELFDQYISESIAVYDPRNDIASYTTTTSDHGPVIARFELKQDVLSTPDFGKNKYYVKAYPNPATDVLSFDVKTTQDRDLKIRLYDFNGRAIGAPISVKNESEISTAAVSVNNLASGVYFYTVSENNKVIFKDKIIKK